MVGKIKYISLIAFFVFLSCNTDRVEPKRNQALKYSEIKLLKNLNRDFQNSIPLKELIQDYFYEPELISENLNLQGVDVLYNGRFNQLSKIGKIEIYQNSTFYFQEEILKSSEFGWILDSNQCETTILVEYPTQNQESVGDFCCCFVENKIYSLFPLWSQYGLIWTREFQIVDGVYVPLIR